MRSNTKLAIVIPRFGVDINGGAELHCMQLAVHLSRYYDITILTTCARDYIKWDNYYPEGCEQYEKLKVFRFKNDKQRNKQEFDSLTQNLISEKKLPTEKQAYDWMVSQGPICSNLSFYIVSNKNEFDCFIFFTYSYATTWFNIGHVNKKSILLPLAHDDWCIRLGIWDTVFKSSKSIIYNSNPEKKLLKKILGNAFKNGKILGVGIDNDSFSSSLITGFEDTFYYIYVGRVEESKGCKQLLDFHLRLSSENIKINLILVGKLSMEIPVDPSIISLGYIPENVKKKLIFSSQFVVMPSIYESLSMVTLEAMSLGKPVLVNYNCNVLRFHAKKSKACFIYKNYNDFACKVGLLLNKRIQISLGKNGKKYVIKNYSWKKIVANYIKIINKIK